MLLPSTKEPMIWARFAVLSLFIMTIMLERVGIVKAENFGYGLTVPSPGAKKKPAKPKSNGSGSPNRAAKAVAAAVDSEPQRFTASGYSSRGFLPPGFVDAVQDLESALQRPVWLCIQQGEDDAATMGPATRIAFLAAREQLAADGPIALLVDSPGGYAEDAYGIARILCRHAGGFTAIVPSFAKSAATLLCLGADQIWMGDDAELGPLDAQQWDNEREEHASALDEIQALERLHQAALEQLDQTMMLMMAGAQKRTEVMLPIACRFVSDMMTPLLEKIDTVHYAKQSRVLKVAEDYARRLLFPTYGSNAVTIANHLVNGYPEHSFVIDREEAEWLLEDDLKPPAEIADAIKRLDESMLTEPPFVAIGRLEEIKQ